MKHFQRDQLTHPQATGVQQLQHGAVAHAQRVAGVGGGQQGLYLGLGEDFGAARGLLGRIQLQGGVGLQHAFAQGPAKEAFEHGQAAVGRGGFGVGVFVGKVGLDIRLGSRQQGAAARGQPGGKQGEVAPVGGQGVFGQALFQPQGIHKSIHTVQAGFQKRGHARMVACKLLP